MKKQRKRAKAASSQATPKRQASATDSKASVSRRGLLVKSLIQKSIIYNNVLPAAA